MAVLGCARGGPADEPTAALNTITHKQLKEVLEKGGVKLIGGGLDEAPFAYKDIHNVMAAQEALMETVATFRLELIKMDGSRLRD